MAEKKILMVFGTRPEAIKMCPLAAELKRREKFEVAIAVTGQHREMLDQVLELFQIMPQYDFHIMKEEQSLSGLMTAVMNGMDAVLEKERPHVVLVHGDTLSAYAAATACYMAKYPVGHVEAGLRTYNLKEPFPEEFNRQSIDMIAKYYFAPTARARDNLLREGRGPHIYVTGNTAIDALSYTVRTDYASEYLREAEGKKLIFVTLHRRENWDGPMEQIFRACKRIADENQKEVYMLYPLHKNPRIRKTAVSMLGECKNIRMTEPLSAADCHNIMARSYFVLTDSGGIQEEAPYFGKPVLVARNVTERPEGVEAGTLKLIGTKEKEVYQSIKELLENSDLYQVMSKSVNPYGDGTACKQIADILEEEL